MTVDIAEAATLLHAQWNRLHRWISDLGPELDGAADQPSVLTGWTIGELVSHLGRGMSALAATATVAPGTVPLSFAEYLGTYPDRGDEITAATKALDAEVASDRLAGIDALAASAFARLDELAGQRVVQARRGPITLRDMVVSRLVELVVHADDLARSLPSVHDDPVDPAALAAVADDLLHIVVMREGFALEVADARLWVRLACGRVPYDVEQLSRALEAPFMSDAVPDLGRVLPLL